MDLTQLANVGEFVGGVAVLVTLVYLVIPVRQGNIGPHQFLRRRSRTSSFDSQVANSSEIHHPPNTHAHHLGFRKGRSRAKDLP